MAAQLDPNTNTREEFTMAAFQQPIPNDADPKWADLNQTLKDLMLKLLNHDAMRANKTQPFMTPAADKNKVYFLWDSVSRTLSNVYKVPPQLRASSQWNSSFDKFWREECLQKSQFVAMQMVEQPSGGARDPMAMMMAMMMASQGVQAPVLGDDIQQLAQKLMNV